MFETPQDSSIQDQTINPSVSTPDAYAGANITPPKYSEDYFNSQQQVQSKVDTLQQKKEEKYAYLKDKVNNQNSLGKDTYTQMTDGTLESNANKIWNNMSDAEYQTMLGDVIGKYGIPKEKWKDIPADQRDKYQWLYMGHGKDNPDLFKIGTAGGFTPSAEYRYEPGRAAAEGYTQNKEYGYASGPGGIDDHNMDAQILLPVEVTTALEAITHGRQNALNNRTSPAGNEYFKNLLGGGYTEYYNNGSEGALGNTSNADLKSINIEDVRKKWQGYLEIAQKHNVNSDLYKSLMQQQALQDIQTRQAASMGTLDRAINVAKSVPTAFIKEVGLDTADWIGETFKRLTGHGWDLGSDEHKSAMADKILGYNPTFSNNASEEAGKYATNLYEDANSTDPNRHMKMDDVVGLLKVGLKTPEILGDSLGYLAGLVLGFGKFTTVGKIALNAERAAKVGDITHEAAQAQIKSAKAAETSAQLVKRVGASNVGFSTIVAGNVNDEIDTFKQNNDGQSPDAYHVVGMLANEGVMNAIDRFTDLSILKAPEAIKKLADAAKYIPEQKAPEIAAKIIVGAAKTTASAGVEAGQEYVQQMGQAFNEQFGSSKYGSDALDILTSKKNIVDALSAAGLGASMGAEMHLGSHAISPTLSLAANALSKAGQSVANGISSIKSTIPEDMTPQEYQDVQVSGQQAQREQQVSQEESNVHKKYYENILGNVARNNVAESQGMHKEQVTPEDISNYLADSKNRSAAAKQLADVILTATQQQEGNDYNPSLVALVKGMKASGDTTIVNDLLSKITTLKGEEATRVFGSSKDFLETLSSLASNNNLSSETESNLHGISQSAYKDIPEDIVRNIIESGRLEASMPVSGTGPSGKNKEQVANEALLGPRGMFTFYRNALIAKAQGNKEEEANQIKRLQYFTRLQNNKINILREGLSKVQEHVAAIENKGGVVPTDKVHNVQFLNLDGTKDTGGFAINYGNVHNSLKYGSTSQVENIIDKVQKEYNIGTDLLTSLETDTPLSKVEPTKTVETLVDVPTSEEKYGYQPTEPEVDMSYYEDMASRGSFNKDIPIENPIVNSEPTSKESKYRGTEEANTARSKAISKRQEIINKINGNIAKDKEELKNNLETLLKKYTDNDILSDTQKNWLKLFIESNGIVDFKGTIEDKLDYLSGTIKKSATKYQKVVGTVDKSLDTMKKLMEDC